MLRKLFVFLLLLLPNLSFAEVHIALVVPLSGPNRLWGNELYRGAEIAVNEINAAGGLLKQKIKLNMVDDACSANLALSTAQMLSIKKEDKPVLVIGPYCSEGLNDIAKLYASSKIFQIVPAFLNSNEAKQNYGGLIKLFGSKEQAAKDIFEFYNERFNPLKVALIKSEPDFSLEESIVDIFKNHGKANLIKTYNLEDYTSLDDLVETLNRDEKQVVLTFNKPRHSAKIIRKFKTLKEDAVFITSRYIADEDFFINAEDYLDTTYFMALPELENKPEMAKNIVNLRLRGIEFKGLNIYGYTAVKMWSELVEKNKTFSYDKLTKNLKKNGFKTSWNETFFNNGNMINPLKYTFYKRQENEYILE